jgi:hypothetical protein
MDWAVVKHFSNDLFILCNGGNETNITLNGEWDRLMSRLQNLRGRMYCEELSKKRIYIPFGGNQGKDLPDITITK